MERLEVLREFEKNLVPHNPENSGIKPEIIGYGEISTIFKIPELEGFAFKRLPLFKSTEEASNYAEKYKKYCGFLKEAGIKLPDDETFIVDIGRIPVSLYIAQKELPSNSIGNKIISDMKKEAIKEFFERIVFETKKVWDFNKKNREKVELSIDGQLSNWALVDNDIYFIDTSTPLFRLNGVEQMNPEPLLKSAPGFLRWILKLFFLDDVMNRYYDERLVYIDFIANLYKEKMEELIPMTIEIINSNLSENIEKIKREDVDKYYKEDKMIWTLFLSFRRFDRFLKTKVFGKRYEFILPGKIER